MKDIHQAIEQMSTQVYQRLLSAVELGKWEDGTVLSEAQRDATQQLVMLYQAKKLDQQDHFTINRHGQINELSKAQLKKAFRGDTIAEFNESEI